MTGYVEYCTIFAGGEEYYTQEVFNDMQELMDLTSFTYLSNMRELYNALEVRLAHVQFNGHSYEESDLVFFNIDSERMAKKLEIVTRQGIV